VPGFGSTSVYANWFRLDPLFTIRMLLHAWHPNSPLSHPALTRRVFFGPAQSDAYVVAFQRRTCRYESFLWPLGMAYPFADPVKVWRGILGPSPSPPPPFPFPPSSTPPSQQRPHQHHQQQRHHQQHQPPSSSSKILILRGSHDKIMTAPIMRQLATFYRLGHPKSLLNPEAGADTSGGLDPVETAVASVDDDDDDDDTAGWGGVSLGVVPGAGHQLQNDVGWAVGADKLGAFWEQL